jgi:RNA polymerase sigma-70 factor (ECF subfamily)
LDRNALELIHDRYYPLVYRYVYFRLGGRGISAQITSQVFDKMLRDLSGKHAPKQNFEAWIFRQAALLVDAHLLAPSEMASPSLVASAVQRPNVVHQNDEDLIEKQQIRLFQRIISGLKPQEQHYLALRFTAARSLGEVADLLGKPVRVLRKVQFQVLSSLAKIFAEID